MAVNDPKDILSQWACPTSRNMLQIIGDGWLGEDDRDAALAYAPAVFILQQAVDIMAQTKELGAQE